MWLTGYISGVNGIFVVLNGHACLSLSDNRQLWFRVPKDIPSLTLHVVVNDSIMAVALLRGPWGVTGNFLTGWLWFTWLFYRTGGSKVWPLQVTTYYPILSNAALGIVRHSAVVIVVPTSHMSNPVWSLEGQPINVREGNMQFRRHYLNVALVSHRLNRSYVALARLIQIRRPPALWSAAEWTVGVIEARLIFTMLVDSTDPYEIALASFDYQGSPRPTWWINPTNIALGHRTYISVEALGAAEYEESK
jgi:hypothetical protein